MAREKPGGGWIPPPPAELGLNYSFVLKKLLTMLGKVEYAKYIPQLKTHSKQKELEQVWEQITKDREWVVALRKRKIV